MAGILKSICFKAFITFPEMCLCCKWKKNVSSRNTQETHAYTDT